MTRLSEFFTLEEMTVSDAAIRLGINNTPGYHELSNLYMITDRLDRIRRILGKPMIVSSGYRSPALNAAIGGSRTSAHKDGLACDFTCPEFGTPLEVCRAIEPYLSELGVDQLIFEGRWVHVGFKDPGSTARHQVLTAHFGKAGVVSYTEGLPA